MKANREFMAVIERDEDGNCLVSFPALHECHPQAKNFDTCVKRTREVIELYLEAGEGVHDPRQFIGIQRISI
jgi:predicted RNase H-like HicB family nuclease